MAKNSKILKKYNKALNELKTPLNEMFQFITELDCKVLPDPVGNKVKMIIFDKGLKVEREPTYSHDEFKLKQLEFIIHFYNKYNGIR